MGRREIRIDLDRAAVHRAWPARPTRGCRERAARARAARLRRPRRCACRAGAAAALRLCQLDRERADDLLHHLVLGREDVGEFAIEPLGPEMPAVGGIDELRRDAHAVAGLADAALEHKAHAEVAPDLLHLRPTGPCRRSDELRAITNRPEIFERSVIRSSVMPSLKYSCSGSPLMFVNGSTAIEGLSGSAAGRAAERGSAVIGADPVDAHRPRDVLELRSPRSSESQPRAGRSTWS